MQGSGCFVFVLALLVFATENVGVSLQLSFL